MKQCPECHESFDNEQNFCDIDGIALVDEADLLRAALQPVAIDEQVVDRVPASSWKGAWFTLPVGVFIGVVLSLFVYMMGLAPKENSELRGQDKSSSAKQQFAPARSEMATSLRPQTTPSPAGQTATSEGNPDTPAVPSPATSPTSSQAKTAAPLLNQGPISTGGKQVGADGRVVIKLKGAGSIEADAAWAEGRNVWYRRGSLVSFVERDRVEEITEPAQPRASPTDGVKP